MQNRVPIRTVLAFALAVLTVPSLTAATLPRASRATASVYAAVTDPQQLSFAADGTLYVGRDNSGSGGDAMDAVKIHRIGPGGAPVQEFGQQAIADPDAVCVDRTGSVSGIPGAVLVAGTDYPGAPTGHFFGIRPDGVIFYLFTDLVEYGLINALAADQTGRVLVLNFGPGARLGWAAPAGITTLAQITGGDGVGDLVTDEANRVWVSKGDGTGLWVFGADGALQFEVAVTLRPGSPLAFTASPFWGTNVYAISPSGSLLSVRADGSARVRGSGFQTTTFMAFGPEDSLYLSEFAYDRVVKVTPDAGLTASIAVATVNICWDSLMDHSYQVQYRSTLTGNEWVNLGPEQAGTGDTLCQNDAVNPAEPRFYRVKETP